MPQSGVRGMATTIVSLLAIATACSSVQTYGGPKRANTEVAILEPGNRARVISIDGRSYTSGTNFALLPGDHTLAFELFVKYRDINPDACVSTSCNRGTGIEDLRVTYLCDVAFAARAGERYRIVLDYDVRDTKYTLQGAFGSFQMRTTIVEIASAETVAEIQECTPQS